MHAKFTALICFQDIKQLIVHAVHYQRLNPKATRVPHFSHIHSGQCPDNQVHTQHTTGDCLCQKCSHLLRRGVPPEYSGQDSQHDAEYTCCSVFLGSVWLVTETFPESRCLSSQTFSLQFLCKRPFPFTLACLFSLGFAPVACKRHQLQPTSLLWIDDVWLYTHMGSLKHVTDVLLVSWQCRESLKSHPNDLDIFVPTYRSSEG